MEDLLKEREEMERSLLTEKDRLVLELTELKENLEKEEKRFKAREAEIRDELEVLLKEREEIRRFQADKNNLML